MATSQVGGKSLCVLSWPLGGVKQHKIEKGLIFAFLVRPGWMEPPHLCQGVE